MACGFDEADMLTICAQYVKKEAHCFVFGSTWAL